jgi:hypothetical protein
MEHAQEIMEELITLILDHIQPPLKFVKLEGDAVFFYLPGAAFLDGQRLLEALESCYFDFADHIVAMGRSTTCRCAACRAIPTLDLKMLAHYGNYLIQRLAGTEDLAGGDVILIHRLLKNDIAAQTGWPAYLFLTDACLAKIGLPLPVARYDTAYEHLGTVGGGAYDLRATWTAMCARRRDYIVPDRADAVFTCRISAPPAVDWDYLLNPDKNILLQDDLVKTTNETLPDGRMGSGTSAHCAHGTYTAIHKYLDWQPFRYFTEWIEQTSGLPGTGGPPACFQTWEFAPAVDGQTDFTVRLRMGDRDSPVLADLAFLDGIVQARYRPMMARLARLLAEAGYGEGAVPSLAP